MFKDNIRKQPNPEYRPFCKTAVVALHNVSVVPLDYKPEETWWPMQYTALIRSWLGVKSCY